MHFVCALPGTGESRTMKAEQPYADKTYYEILGVPEDASLEAIRSAFRKLARQFHPDVNNAADAEERFKAINEAFSVLSDRDKRADYDWKLKNSRPARDPDPPPPPSPGRRERGGAARPPDPGLDVEASVNVSFETAMGGKALQVQYRRMKPCPACHGRKTVFNVRCLKCKATGTTSVDDLITISIPAGAEDGTVLTFPGAGNISPENGYAGRLILTLRVETHPFLRREGDDLVCEISIHMVEAALGTQVTIPTLDGERAMLIPPATQPGSALLLPGFGVGGRGNLRVIVHVEIPRQNFIQTPILKLYRRVTMGGQRRVAGKIFRL